MKANDTVKIFILYLMQNVGHPLDFVSVNDMVQSTDYVKGFDCREAFTELVDSDLLIDTGDRNEYGEPLYLVTEKGACVCEELCRSRIPSVLDDAIATALRFLDFQKRGIKLFSRIEEVEGGRFRFVCGMTEHGTVILESTILVDTRIRAEQMEKNFRDRPEAVYRGTMALLSGNVNYLL